MTTSTQPRWAAGLNNLRRGGAYRAVTRTGSVAVGEYLGIEVVYGDWCILLRGDTGTISIPTSELEVVAAQKRAA